MSLRERQAAAFISPLSGAAKTSLTALCLCSLLDKIYMFRFVFGVFFVHAPIPGLHGSIWLCVGQPWPWPTLAGQTWPKQAWPPLVDNAHLLDSATSTQQGRLRTTRPPLLNEVGSFQ